MKLFALVVSLVFCGFKVHSMPTSHRGKQYVRSVGNYNAAEEVTGLNDEDRVLLYNGPLYKNCPDLIVWCKLGKGGYAIYILIVGAIVATILACSHCVAQFRKLASVSTLVAASAKKNADHTGTSSATMNEVRWKTEK
jgi:hypothetical protein